MNKEQTMDLLNEIEKKSLQMRAIVDGLASMGVTVCKKDDTAHICFTGPEPHKAFHYMASIAGDLQIQISEHIACLFEGLPE